jgi:predicted nucleotidyltransferase
MFRVVLCCQVDELVRRIVDSVHPLRIIVFGSAARGRMRPDSAVDVLVPTPTDLARHRDNPRVR